MPRDLAGFRSRAATRLEFASVAIQFAGAVRSQAIGADAAPRRRVDSAELHQFLARRACEAVVFGIEDEVVARERSVRPARSVEHGNERLNLLLVDEPVQALRGTVSAVGVKGGRLDAEAGFRPLESSPSAKPWRGSKSERPRSMQPSAPKRTPFSRQDSPFSYRSGKPDNLCTFVSSPQLCDRR